MTLFEKAPELGGQFRLAMAVPGKEDFAETLRYFTRRLEVLGVDVRLSTEATAADLAAYDEVVVATGVVPRDAGDRRHRPPRGGVVRRRAERRGRPPASGSR